MIPHDRRLDSGDCLGCDRELSMLRLRTILNSTKLAIGSPMHALKSCRAFCASLVDPELAPTALKVSLIVGSLLFTINHGAALFQGKMDRGRWLSAMLTFLVPYSVNIHGQYSAKAKQIEASRLKNS